MTETLEPGPTTRTSNVESADAGALQRVLRKTKRPGAAREKGALRAAWREFFTAEAARAEAAARSFTAGDAGWRAFALGRAALAEARPIADSGVNGAVALLLYRAAVGLLLVARATRQVPTATTTPLSTGTHWDRYSDADEGAEVVRRLTSEQLSLVAALLHSETFEVTAAGLSDADVELANRGLVAIATALALALERQRFPLRQVERRHWLRLGATAFVLTMMGAVVWDRTALPKNFALHGQVTVTQNIDELVATPNQLVDGDRTNLGFHTDDAPNRSATIDLGRIISISQIVVYNRADCCQERAVPLWLEVSQDGVNFTRVALRQTPFLRWNARIIASRARYVRLTHEAAGCFHLSEVEVY